MRLAFGLILLLVAASVASQVLPGGGLNSPAGQGTQRPCVTPFGLVVGGAC